MLKTSFMQRVGGSEGKLVPPEFTDLANKVKNLKALLEELVERVKITTKSIASTCKRRCKCVCLDSIICPTCCAHCCAPKRALSSPSAALRSDSSENTYFTAFYALRTANDDHFIFVALISLFTDAFDWLFFRPLVHKTGYSQASIAFGTTLAEFAAFLPADDVLGTFKNPDWGG